MRAPLARSTIACAWLGAALLASVVLRLLSQKHGLGFPEGADVFALRWERVVAGVSVGAALGIGGALLQAILRNPLASPFLLGLTSGAGLGVVIATYAAFLATGSILLAGAPIAPVLLGAFGALGLVYLLAQRGGTPEPTSLVLVGVIVSVLCAALTTFFQHLLPAQGMAVYTRWVMGSISSDTDGWLLYTVLGATGAGVAWAMSMGRELDAAALTDDEARSVGVALGSLRARCVLLAGCLTAGSVLLAGPLAFVGLIAPHLARRLAGPGHRWGLLATAFAGAALVVFADAGVAIVRTPGGRMPIGVLTALLGGPLFLYLLRKGRAL